MVRTKPDKAKKLEEKAPKPLGRKIKDDNIPKPTTHCDICQKFLSTSSSLSRHRETVHFPETLVKVPCVWPGCNFKSAQKSNVDSHVQARHLKTKDHDCPVCSKPFATASNLLHHLDLHADGNLVIRKGGRGKKNVNRESSLVSSGSFSDASTGSSVETPLPTPEFNNSLVLHPVDMAPVQVYEHDNYMGPILDYPYCQSQPVMDPSDMVQVYTAPPGPPPLDPFGMGTAPATLAPYMAPFQEASFAAMPGTLDLTTYMQGLSNIPGRGYVPAQPQSQASTSYLPQPDVYAPVPMVAQSHSRRILSTMDFNVDFGLDAPPPPIAGFPKERIEDIDFPAADANVQFTDWLAHDITL